MFCTLLFSPCIIRTLTTLISVGYCFLWYIVILCKNLLKLPQIRYGRPQRIWGDYSAPRGCSKCWCIRKTSWKSARWAKIPTHWFRQRGYYWIRYKFHVHMRYFYTCWGMWSYMVAMRVCVYVDLSKQVYRLLCLWCTQSLINSWLFLLLLGWRFVYLDIFFARVSVKGGRVFYRRYCSWFGRTGYMHA